MQDRFKYRAYHKPTKTLFDVYGFNKDFIFADTLDGIGTQFNPVRTNECELIQCTGLKDKNGKLIFEGDILKVADGSINGHILYFTKVVKWEINRWVNCPYWLKRETDPTHFAEIIGNIYENPELLGSEE